MMTNDVLTFQAYTQYSEQIINFCWFRCHRMVSPQKNSAWMHDTAHMAFAIH